MVLEDFTDVFNETALDKPLCEGVIADLLSVAGVDTYPLFWGGFTGAGDVSI